MGIDISKITDIKELKALKADQYDRREFAQVEFQQATQAINLIHARIVEIEQNSNSTSGKSTSDHNKT